MTSCLIGNKCRMQLQTVSGQYPYDLCLYYDELMNSVVSFYILFDICALKYTVNLSL